MGCDHLVYVFMHFCLGEIHLAITADKQACEICPEKLGVGFVIYFCASLVPTIKLI